MPCEGIFADIRKEEVEVVDENTPGMKHILEAYEKYKNQFQDEIPYPPAIIGKRTNCILISLDKTCFRLQI